MGRGASSRSARRATAARSRRCGSRATKALRVAATLPRYPRGRARRPGSRRRPDPGAARGPVRRLPPPDRRRRHAPDAVARGPARQRGSRHRPRATPAARRRGARGRDPGARGGPRGGHRHRPARPRRSRPRGGLHDGRGEPRRRDLRLEHRDRRGDCSPRSAAGSVAPAAGARDSRPRSSLYVAFAGASASVVRAAAMAGVVLVARESGRAGRAAAALGWAALLLLLVDPHLVVRRRVPAVVARDRRDPRLGDAVRGVARGEGAARLPGWLAECLGGLARRPGRDAAGRAAVVRPARDRLAGREPRRRAARRAGDGRVRWSRCSAGSRRSPAAPAVVATILGLPAWVLLVGDVRVVQAGAALPFASATLEPPWNGVAAGGAAVGVLAVAAGRRLAIVGRWRQRRAARRTRVVTVERRTREPSRTTVVGDASQSRAAGRRRRPRRCDDGARPRRRPSAGRRHPDHGPRRRAGRRDPRRGQPGRPDARRRRAGPGPAARRARQPAAAVGPPDRRRRPDAPARGPRRRAAAPARALPGRPGLRERACAVPDPATRPGRPPSSGRARRDAERCATGDTIGVDDIRFAVLWPDPGCVPREPPDSGRGINDVSIVLLGEVGGRAVPADRRRRGRRRPDPRWARPATGRLPEGRPSRQRDGVERGAARDDPPAPGRDLGRRGQHLRPPGAATIARLRSVGAVVERTDLDGAVEVVDRRGLDDGPRRRRGARNVDRRRQPGTRPAGGTPARPSRRGARYHRADDPSPADAPRATRAGRLFLGRRRPRDEPRRRPDGGGPRRAARRHRRAGRGPRRPQPGRRPDRPAPAAASRRSRCSAAARWRS